MRPNRVKSPDVFTICLTPFDASERLDEEAYRLHLRRMVDAGMGLYVGSGSSGEAFTLSPQETRRVYEISAEEANGKVPCRVMGSEPRTAQAVIDRYHMLKDLGFDAMQVHSLDGGHTYVPDRRDLERFFRDILDVVQMPVVLSSHFAVGYNAPLDLIDKLVDEYDQVVGVNCTPRDTSYMARLIDLVGDKVDVHSGGPQMAFQTLALGGQGFMCSEGNVAPRFCKRIMQAFNAGDTLQAFQGYGKLLRLSAGLSHSGNKGNKAALKILGLPGGYSRRPRLALGPEDEKKVARVLDELDIRGEEGLN